MYSPGDNHEYESYATASSDDRENPQSGHTNVCQCLKSARSKRVRQQTQDISSGSHAKEGKRIEPVYDLADYNKGEIAAYRMPICLRSFSLDGFQHCQTVGKTYGEKELRHDGVGIAAVGVVMLENGMNSSEHSKIIDKKHPYDRIPAKLVERVFAAFSVGDCLFNSHGASSGKFQLTKG